MGAPTAPQGMVLGKQQLHDKGNTRAGENSGAAAARGCLKSRVRLDVSSGLSWQSSRKRETGARNQPQKPSETPHSEQSPAASAEPHDRFEG